MDEQGQPTTQAEAVKLRTEMYLSGQDDMHDLINKDMTEDELKTLHMMLSSILAHPNPRVLAANYLGLVASAARTRFRWDFLRTGYLPDGMPDAIPDDEPPKPVLGMPDPFEGLT